MNWQEAGVPNPGSKLATTDGCTCPVMDNNFGNGSDWGDGIFWITGGCPLHTRDYPDKYDETLDFVARKINKV